MVPSNGSLRELADVLVGAIFGVLAGSNLVQGAWLTQAPWLDLTSASFALAIPVALCAITRRVSRAAVAGVLLLATSLAFGFLEPALSGSAEAKRLSIVVAVLILATASALSLTNRRRLVAFFVTIVVLALIVVAGQFLFPDPSFLASGRRTPEGLNSIGAGRVIGAALCITVAGIAAATNPRRRLGLLGLAVPLIVGLVLAGSRGPIIGALAGALLIIWRHPALWRAQKSLLTAAVVTLGWVTYQVLLTSGSHLVTHTASGRQRLYEDAIDIGRANPLGIGWGNFYRYVQSTPAASLQGENLYAHNILLEFWIEAGVLGVAMFCVFLTVVAVRGHRQSATVVGITLAALTLNLFVGSLFSSDIVGNRMLWVCCGAILAGGLISQTSSQRKSRPRNRTGRRRLPVRFASSAEPAR